MNEIPRANAVAATELLEELRDVEREREAASIAQDRVRFVALRRREDALRDRIHELVPPATEPLD